MLTDGPLGLIIALLFSKLVGLKLSCLSINRLIITALFVLMIESCLLKQLLISISLTLSIEVDLLKLLPPRECGEPIIYRFDYDPACFSVSTISGACTGLI